MKILAASDTHNDKKLIRELAGKAEKEKVDIVILCGDITFMESDLEGILGPFRKKGKKVLVVPGNHESVASVDFLVELYGKEECKNMHGYSVVMKDKKGEKIGFFGCGSANIGPFSYDDKKIEDVLRGAGKKVSRVKRKIMITHVPPYDSGVDKVGVSNTGSRGVRKVITELKPELCLCGHIHETAGKQSKIGKTKVINVGKKGTIIKV